MSGRPETAEYLMVMAGELAILARDNDFDLASKLFEMAHLNLSQELKTPEEDAVANSA